LWVVAIVAVGGLWWFPDAISRLRTLGAPYAEAEPGCDLAVGPCTAAFPDGTEVQLRAFPQPAGPEDPVQVSVTVKGASRPVALEVQGADMAMGFLRLPLVEADGHWSVSASLPACTTAQMRWKADVVLEDRVAGFFLWSTR
jgi:hypothetical protein